MHADALFIVDACCGCRDKKKKKRLLSRVSSVDSFERLFLRLHICRIGPGQLDRRVLYRGLKAYFYCGFLVSLISYRRYARVGGAARTCIRDEFLNVLPEVCRNDRSLTLVSLLSSYVFVFFFFFFLFLLLISRLDRR